MITANIDPYIFEKQYEAFKRFVEEKTNVPFVSFASHPYTDEQEGYKYQIYRTARDRLSFQAWKIADIGSGEIISATIESIEFQNNNLVQWQSRYGDDKRPHQPLFEAQGNSIKTAEIERVLFNLYHKIDNAGSFNELLNIFGKKYALLAYLYFIKDSSKYLPIAPTYFDKTFKLLGADFKTRQLCSWENYSLYISLVEDIKTLLAEELLGEVSLLDAHSFAWMLSAQMDSENKLADVSEYLNLSTTEKETITKSRIGQGQFRQSLIDYWSSCAITGCEEQRLLRASHIKPWAKSTATERLSLYNGLLLSPTLDVCFDSGLISFDDLGNIIISNKLSCKNMEALSINKNMKLSKISQEHQKYLKYHRNHIYKQS